MPLSKSDLPTPALLLDLEAFTSNLTRMQDSASSAGKRLRPHAKAHKCVEIARRQMRMGAEGVCVATISEMALMCSAAIPVLLTTPIGSRKKTDFIAALAAKGARVRVVVDHLLQVAWRSEEHT